MDRSALARKPVTELKDIASHLDMRGYQKLRKAELIDAIISSGSDAAAGGQQELVADSTVVAAPSTVADAGPDAGSGLGAEAGGSSAGAETPEARDRRVAREESARKVLPPSARQTSSGSALDPSTVDRSTDRSADRSTVDRSTDRSADRSTVDRSTDRSTGERGTVDRSRSRDERPAGGPDEGRDAGRERAETRDRTTGRDANGRDANGRDANGRDANGRDANGRDKSGRDVSGRDSGGRDSGGRDSGGRDTGGRDSEGRDTGRDKTRDGGGRDGSAGDARDIAARDAASREGSVPDVDLDAEDDDDDDDAAGRKRRNRRDRRKRNRDRQGEEVVAPAPTAPPSGNDPGEVRAGVLDILPEGYGFLRTTGYLPGERDVYVSQGQIRKHALRRGDVVQGPIRQQRSNEKVPALHHVERVNGDELEDGQVADRADFDELTPIHSDERLSLTTAADGAQPSAAARLIDLVAPIGRGQRAVVVAPPRSGKTVLLRELAQALADASPDSHLMAVLVDERPEEISEMVRTFPGEVIASGFDRAAEDHTQIAELAIERARRLVELGHDVIVLIDSLTRLARAYGVTVQGTGRAIAPGVEAASLYPVKRLFAAARNLDEGGSLTIVGTALSGTASNHDQVILEELVRVANTIVHLDGVLARRRVHPAIAILDSGTDNESALQDEDELVAVRSLRRLLEAMPGDAATELVLDKLAQTDRTEDLLAQIRDAAR